MHAFWLHRNQPPRATPDSVNTAVLTVAAAGLAVAGSVNAQARIAVGPNVQASKSRSQVEHIEVTIAADPANANRLIACSMLTGGVAAYVSFDAGATWSAPVTNTGAPRANDPTCAYGPNGAVYFVHKLKETAGPSDLDRLAVHRSLDGGRVWDAMVLGPQTTDRPWIAVDRRPSEGPHGRLLVSYNYHVHGENTLLAHKQDFLNAVALQASTDGGRTFSTFAMRALMGDSAHPFRQPGMAGTAVLRDGTALALYEHSVGGGPNPKTGKTMVVSSALMIVRSRDGGNSIEPAFKVADISTTYNEPHTRGVTAAIASSQSSHRFGNRAWVAWGDVGSGRAEILAAYSDDGGSTWSQPARISDPPSPSSGNQKPDHFMPVLAVNNDGIVGALWYDRRDNPDNLSYYARFSASTDGGVTWLPSVRVSSAPHTARGKSGTGVTSGDTAGLAASADGRFHALWIDNRTGVQQAWTAPITVVTR